MLLQLIIIQRHSRIVSVNRLARLETSRLFRNIIQIRDEAQEWLHLFAGSAVQFGIETNECFPPLINFRDELNLLDVLRFMSMILEILKTFDAIIFLILEIGAVLLETLIKDNISLARASDSLCFHLYT